MYEDKTLICKDCGAEFVFTAGEQEFYASKGFVNDVNHAVMHVKTLQNRSAKCTQHNALLADAKQKFHLNHVKTVLYTAASALLR